MKRLYITLLLLIGILPIINCQFGTAVAQQQFRLWSGGESTRFTIASASEITFSNNGATLTIGSNSDALTYNVSDIDSLVMIHQVLIEYKDTTASFTIPEAVAADVTITREHAHVTVTNTNVSNEIEFVLSGTSNDGSFTYNGSYKATVRLNGVNLTSQQGGAINILCGKRIAMVLEDGTANTFADSAEGEQKACLYCKGHLEIEGGGTLNVTGNATHAIKTKEYLQLKKSTGAINIVKAASDAIHVGQYYLQNGGNVNITSTTQGDGIQIEYLTLDDDVTPDPEKELNGQAIFNGGTLNIEISHEDCEAIKAVSDITINEGSFTITASGNGSRGIQTDSNMVIGIKGGTNETPTITIYATGGLCTNPDDKEDPHRCMGIKVDGNLTVYAGTTVVKNTGTKSRGIKVDGTYSKKGGIVSASIKN